jgi:hypothetical protein
MAASARLGDISASPLLGVQHRRRPALEKVMVKTANPHSHLLERNSRARIIAKFTFNSRPLFKQKIIEKKEMVRFSSTALGTVGTLNRGPTTLGHKHAQNSTLTMLQPLSSQQPPRYQHKLLLDS